MDEIERYKIRLQRKWDRRTTRRADGGRRVSDYKPPRFWSWKIAVQFFIIVISGIVVLLLEGCLLIKKSILGG